MEPAIKNGQKILVSNIPFIFSNPKKNDIIAFNFDNKIFVKRMEKIENGKYFLQGDNKNDSLDSRKLGLVKRKDILGKVIWS
jgi:phage repressor protein C with HTH and peptisase S24 domain